MKHMITGNDTRADITKFMVVLHSVGTTILLELDEIGFGTEKTRQPDYHSNECVPLLAPLHLSMLLAQSAIKSD